MSEHAIRLNRYLPIAVLYFFFNGFLLPLGLLYTTLLTPFFILWLYPKPAFRYFWIFFIVTIPFLLVHLLNGVELLSYAKSYVLLFTVFVFGLSFYQFLQICQSLPDIFRSLVLINFFLVLLAVIAFFIPGLREVFWYNNELTYGVQGVLRLKMFTYEASYYSFLLVPVFLYYCIKGLIFPFGKVAVPFWLLVVSLLLSLSFGVILVLVLTLFFLVSSDLKVLFLKQKAQRYVLTAFIGFLAILFIVLQFFPDNLVFVRIENVFRGRDSSFSGRTFDSIYLGWKIAAQKSIFFGAGPGQTKVLGLELFNEFYNNNFTLDKLTIPNNIGDTLAQFGILGVLIKLSLEVYFFFRSRVYSNYYRLGLFLFIFIYQFTGSFITNIAEYVIWILAFYRPLFPEFEKNRIFNKTAPSPGWEPALPVVPAESARGTV